MSYKKFNGLNTPFGEEIQTVLKKFGDVLGDALSIYKTELEDKIKKLEVMAKNNVDEKKNL